MFKNRQKTYSRFSTFWILPAILFFYTGFSLGAVQEWTYPSSGTGDYAIAPNSSLSLYVSVSNAPFNAVITNVEAKFEYIAWGTSQDFVSARFNRGSIVGGEILVNLNTLPASPSGGSSSTVSSYKSFSTWNGQGVNSTYYFNFVDNGSIYGFTIKKVYVRITYAIPSIDVTYPNGGETLTKGQGYTIQWTSSYVTGNVLIHLYKGSSHIRTPSSSTTDDGSYYWIFPADLTDGTDYRIGMSAMSGTVSNFSGYFTVQAPPDAPVIDLTSETWDGSRSGVQESTFPYNGDVALWLRVQNSGRRVNTYMTMTDPDNGTRYCYYADNTFPTVDNPDKALSFTSSKKPMVNTPWTVAAGDYLVNRYTYSATNPPGTRTINYWYEDADVGGTIASDNISYTVQAQPAAPVIDLTSETWDGSRSGIQESTFPYNGDVALWLRVQNSGRRVNTYMTMTDPDNGTRYCYYADNTFPTVDNPDKALSFTSSKKPMVNTPWTVAAGDYLVNRYTYSATNPPGTRTINYWYEDADVGGTIASDNISYTVQAQPAAPVIDLTSETWDGSRSGIQESTFPYNGDVALWLRVQNSGRRVNTYMTMTDPDNGTRYCYYADNTFPTVDNPDKALSFTSSKKPMVNTPWTVAAGDYLVNRYTYSATNPPGTRTINYWYEDPDSGETIASDMANFIIVAQYEGNSINTHWYNWAGSFTGYQTYIQHYNFIRDHAWWSALENGDYLTQTDWDNASWSYSYTITLGNCNQTVIYQSGYDELVKKFQTMDSPELLLILDIHNEAIALDANDITFDQYYDYVNQIVERYDGDGFQDMPGLVRPVKYFEIGNEIDSSNPEHSHNLTMDNYVLNRLIPAYLAAKQANPDSMILNAGLSLGGDLGFDTSNLEDMLVLIQNNGGPQNNFFSDIQAIHYYFDPQNPEYFDQNFFSVNTILSSFGLDAKPIWVTEFGIATKSDVGGTIREEDQASVLLRYLALMKFYGIENEFIYCLKDANSADKTNWENVYGINRVDCQGETEVIVPKQAVNVVDNFLTMTNGYSFDSINSLSERNQGIYKIIATSSDSKIQIIWFTAFDNTGISSDSTDYSDETTTIPVDLGGETGTLYDMNGTLLQNDLEDGSTITIGENPQYIKYNTSLQPPDPNSFYLRFPLEGYTPYTAPITAVFDHSMTGPYSDDNVVIAFTGEYGESKFGRDFVWGTHYGFKQDVEETPFIVNGNDTYTGGGDNIFLYYDGHPGIDYSTGGLHLPVYAAAPGTAFHDNLNLGEIYVDHGNGYTTHYLHLLVDGNLIPNNTEVVPSTQIGLAGGTGGFPVHLHFEVRKDGIPVDPYGWSGAGSDPYKNRADNVNLWLPLCPASPKDRSLVRLEGQGTIYWLQNGKKYRVLNQDILNDMSGFPGWKNICDYSEGILNTYPDRPNFIDTGVGSNGLLIQENGDSKVYLIENGTKRWISSETVFNNLEYDWSDIILIPSDMLTNNGFGNGQPISADNVLTLDFLNELFGFDWDIYDRESIYSIVQNCLKDTDYTYTYFVFWDIIRKITPKINAWINSYHSMTDNPVGIIRGQMLITPWLDAVWGNNISTDDSFNTVYAGEPSADDKFEVISFIDEIAPFCGTTNEKCYFFTYDTKDDANGDAVTLSEWIEYLKAITVAYGRPIDILTIFAHGFPAKVNMSDSFQLKDDLATRLGIERLKNENILAGDATILLFSCNVGKDVDGEAVGEAFVQNLANWSGAVVYANSVLTGPKVEKDGIVIQDWDLDVVRQPETQWEDQVPIAVAEAPVTTPAYSLTTLDGTKSFDSDGGIASYSWVQTKGTGVALSNAGSSQPAFTAPSVSNEEILEFQLTVSDSSGHQTSDTIEIIVKPVNSPSAPPTGLNAVYQSSPNRNYLKWNHVINAMSYKVYWGTERGVSTASNVMPLTTTTDYSHTGVKNGYCYYYRVASVNAAGIESRLSSESSVCLPVSTPEIPLGIKASYEESNGRNYITWNQSTDTTGYKVYWGTSPGVTKASQVMPETVTLDFGHTGVEKGSCYYYKVAAINSVGESELSAEEVSVCVPASVPQVPYDVTATYQSSLDQNIISWNSGGDATSFKVYWDSTPGVTLSSQLLTETEELRVTHADLLAGSSYYYRVSAVNQSGESALSPEVSVCLAISLPEIPKGLSVINQKYNNSNFISWDQAANATGYVVYWGTTPGVTKLSQKMPETVTTDFEHSGVEGGSCYYYRVAAVNAVGESDLSSEQSVCVETVQIFLSPISRIVSADSGIATFDVHTGNTNSPWSASVSEPWLTILSGTAGIGNGVVSVSYSKNQGTERTGTITVSAPTATNSPQIFYLTQACIPDTTSPTVTITQPTSGPTYETQNNALNIAGTAWDNVAVTEVTWSNNQGGSGTCNGTESWSAEGIVLYEGENVITVNAQDAAGNPPGDDTLTVTYFPQEGPEISLSLASLTNACWQNQNAYNQGFEVWNSGVGTLNYSVSTDAPWLSCDPLSGSSTGEHDAIKVTYTTKGLAPGEHYATITISDPGASNSPQTIAVTLTVVSGRQGAPISDTGQTTSYTGTFGEDSDYTINPPWYTKLDASGNDLPDSAAEWVMVRDNVTGLIWEVKTDDGSIHDKDNQYTWYDSNTVTNGGNEGTQGDGTDTEDFINELNSSGFGGFSDWSVPTIKELASIVNLGCYDPAVDTDYFLNTQLSPRYWSSTTRASDNSGAWDISFGYGIIAYSPKYSVRYVRAVRGRQIDSTYIDNGDGTITDFYTGLMWQKETDGIMNWEDAINHCETNDLAGYYDWRLPNRRELSSIVKFKSCEPAIDIDHFPNTESSYYWSSTSCNYDCDSTWRINFQSGLIHYEYKTSGCYVREVRGGQNKYADRLYITMPSQGSSWNDKRQMPIRWETQGINGNVKISLSRHGGKEGTFDTIVASAPNTGSYDWTVTGEASVNCVLKIEPLLDPGKGTIQGLFTILASKGMPWLMLLLE